MLFKNRWGSCRRYYWTPRLVRHQVSDYLSPSFRFSCGRIQPLLTTNSSIENSLSTSVRLATRLTLCSRRTLLPHLFSNCQKNLISNLVCEVRISSACILRVKARYVITEA